MNDSCFAYFRLPGERRYYRILTDRVVKYEAPMDNHSGFIAFPFSESPESPAVFFPADTAECFSLPEITPSGKAVAVLPLPVDEGYRTSFRTFHDAVSSGKFRKLVLSRTKLVRTGEELDLLASFFRACNEYPGMMVELFSSPQTGTWLISSPEPLLETDGRVFHTVALAGTMADCDGTSEWSEKDRSEQQVVSEYISGRISFISNDVRMDGPHTHRAGNLVHLKTDIFFTQDDCSPAFVASRLHPTPAVCGMPQKEALDFITGNEGIARRYYSGYCGPAGIDGRTCLYVSLRCASISEDRRSVTLHAGGGIMPQSVCESEFEETENKMQTIARCLVTK